MVCPRCGYCPHCGRAAHGLWGAWYPYMGYPYQGLGNWQRQLQGIGAQSGSLSGGQNAMPNEACSHQ